MGTVTEIPQFKRHDEQSPNVALTIQPALALRNWSELAPAEKQTVLQELKNKGWIENRSDEILTAITYLNSAYLRTCPGKNLHKIKPEKDDYRHTSNRGERQDAALKDFEAILLKSPDDPLVLTMLSAFAEAHIDRRDLQNASNASDEADRAKWIVKAFENFDPFARSMNRIFGQFAVNQLVTRGGFVPRQDDKITEEIYVPTLRVLADPKWKSVSADLSKMFADYRERNYPEAITKAHSALQRFLQVLVGEEGKSGQGELSKLFAEAKGKGIIPINVFTSRIVGAVEAFLPSERATNSTAKPSIKDASPSEALLVMNVLMVFLQFCLQNSTK